MNTNLIFEAVKRINKYLLSIFDMIHYTCTLINNCESIVSYDKDFDGLEILREEA